MSRLKLFLPVLLFSYCQSIYAQFYNLQYLTNNGTTTTCKGYVTSYDTTAAGCYWTPNGTNYYYTYCGNQTYTQTFCSASGQQIRFTLTDIFDVRPNKDYLYIYDGPSTASPLIGTLTGNINCETTPTFFTSSGTCLTIKWRSTQANGAYYTDGSSRYEGWQGILGCGPLNGCNGNLPAGDDCSSAPIICDLSSYCGNTSGWYTPNNAANLSLDYVSGLFCGSIENNSFIEFTAGSTSASIIIKSSNCATSTSGIQGAIFNAGACGASPALVSNCVSQSTAPGTFTLTSNTALTPGNNYYIMIDGYGGNYCDYTLSAATGVQVYAMSASTTSVCAGTSASLSISPANASSYAWSASTGSAISGSTTGASITATPSVTTTYSCSIVGNTGCSKTFTTTITVNPSPTYSLSGNNYTLCSGGSQVLTASGANTYTWTPATGLSGANVSNPTASPVTTTVYSVTGTSASGCTNPIPATVTVTVNPLPVMSLSGNTYTICNGGSQTFTVSGASSYTWTPSATLTNANTANPTASPVTTTIYSVTGTSVSGCSNTTPATVTVNVTPIPSINLSANNYAICLGSSQTFTASGANSYTWTPAASLNNANIASPTANPTTTTIYTVSGTASGCAPSSPVTLTLTINPLPSYSLTGNSYTLCSGGAQVITASGANTYTWTPASGLSGTNVSNPTASPTSTTVYSVTGTSASGCKNTTPATVTVSVNPKPSYTLVGNAYTICNGGSQTFTVSGASSYTWTPSNTLTNANTANPTASPTTTTIYSVTGTNSLSCTNPSPATVTVTVTSSPAISVSATSYSICQGASQILSASGVSSYSWTPASNLNNPNSPSPTANPTATTVYTVNGTANGCAPSAPVTLTLTINPLPKIDTTGMIITQSNCTSSTGSISNISYTASPTASYVWTVNSSTVVVGGNSPTLNAVPQGDYCVQVTDGNSCRTKFCYITVNNAGAPATPTLSVAGNDTVYCQGNTIQPLVANVSNSGTVTPTINWYSDVALTNTLSVNSNSYTPVSLPVGTTTLYITANANGCSSFVRPITITINPAPVPPSISNGISNPLIECQGATAATISLTTNASTIPIWYVGTNTVNVGQSYTPGTSLSGTTVYIISDSSTVTGCTNLQAGNAITVTVTINPAPTPPSISNGVSNPLIECQGATAATISLTTNANSIPVWYVGTNTVNIGQTFAPNTSIPGTTVFIVSDSSTVTGCTNLQTGNAITVTVTIKPAPIPPSISNGVSNPLVECQGATAATISLTTNASTIPIWYVGTNTVNVGQSYTPGTSLSGTTVYIISDSSTVTGCTNLQAGNAIKVTVTINPAPTPPSISNGVSNPLIECQGATAATISLTTNASTIPIWYVGTNTVNVGQSYTPGTSSSGTTVYIISDSSTVTGCTNLLAGNAIKVTVTIHPSPTLDISGLLLDTARCGKSIGSVSGVNVVGGTPSFTYQWFNAQGPIAGATGITLSNEPAGTYTLIATDANGCVATAGGTVPGFSIPGTASVSAQFSLSPDIGTVPLTVSFTNNSTSGSTSTWYFGNASNTSVNTLNPSYTYTAVGTYVATLVVIKDGCRDTTHHTITVEVPTTLTVPNVFSPNGDGINDDFFIINSGLVNLTCDIYNRWGQLVSTLNAPNQFWDGRVPNGDKAPDGTYMYILQAKGLDGKIFKQEGTITLIR